jgi:hypothetical protein
MKKKVIKTRLDSHTDIMSAFNSKLYQIQLELEALKKQVQPSFIIGVNDCRDATGTGAHSPIRSVTMSETSTSDSAICWQQKEVDLRNRILELEKQLAAPAVDTKGYENAFIDGVRYANNWPVSSNEMDDDTLRGVAHKSAIEKLVFPDTING